MSNRTYRVTEIVGHLRDRCGRRDPQRDRPGGADPAAPRLVRGHPGPRPGRRRRAAALPGRHEARLPPRGRLTGTPATRPWTRKSRRRLPDGRDRPHGSLQGSRWPRIRWLNRSGLVVHQAARGLDADQGLSTSTVLVLPQHPAPQPRSIPLHADSGPRACRPPLNWRRRAFPGPPPQRSAAPTTL